MINIFDYIKDILYRKKGTLLSNQDSETQFQPYMVQRWLSMYSPKMAKLLNQTLNRRWSAFESTDKQAWYKIFLVLVPRSPFRKIAYIKKNKELKKADPERQQLIKYLAAQMEMSEKEIHYIIDTHNIDIAKYKKMLK